MPLAIRLILILFISFISTSIPATGQRLLLGLKGGATFSSGIGADARGSALRLGGHGGVLTRVSLPSGFALQTEVLYCQRGDNATEYGFTIGRRLTYLDVPLLIQYHQEELFVEAGAQYSWLLAQSVNPPVVVRPYGLTMQPREVSFVVGFGYQDPAGLSVGWRYVGGLNNVFRPGEISGSGQRQIRNGSLQFYLNYLFEPRQLARGSVNTGRLVFVKLPVELYKGGRFLFYTAPASVIRAIRRPSVPHPEPPAPQPATPPTP